MGIKGTNRYKIGYTTRSISERIAGLQTGCPDTISEVCTYKTSMPVLLELSLHGAYKGKRINGEWFELTDDDVAGFKAMCEKFETAMKYVMENNSLYQTGKRNIF